ncbi:unnamed protein product [Schistosoma turkestanicum]|nr:unnamed protein product [Schistosoma turkestanicum]
MLFQSCIATCREVSTYTCRAVGLLDNNYRCCPSRVRNGRKNCLLLKAIQSFICCW